MTKPGELVVEDLLEVDSYGVNYALDGSCIALTFTYSNGKQGRVKLAPNSALHFAELIEKAVEDGKASAAAGREMNPRLN
jgi:hypothetical protein